MKKFIVEKFNIGDKNIEKSIFFTQNPLKDFLHLGEACSLGTDGTSSS
jgi:hypothetical protein